MDKSKYNGIFVPKDGIGAGHLSIAGNDTQLKLTTTAPKDASAQEFQDIHGFLADGSKASLLDCIQTSSNYFAYGKVNQFETRFFPHFVIVGDEFLCSRDSKIHAIYYTFENSRYLVNESENFGTVYPTREELVNIIEADRRRLDKLALKENRLSSHLNIEVGKRPILQYFDGKFTITESQAKVGSVKLANRISHQVGASQGVHINNEITASLNLNCPANIRSVFEWLGVLHSLFVLCLGRCQRILTIEVGLVNQEENADDSGTRPLLQVHWSHSTERMFGKTTSTRPIGGLFTPTDRASEFESVLANWLDGEACLGEARSRFTHYFLSGRYDVDRIIGSANMFDLLPETHVPSSKTLDEQAQHAVDDCRKRFIKLPIDSAARHHVLTALGRVNHPSLCDKVLHRAQIVINNDQELLEELHIPCTQAIRCRNRFVHGTKGNFDYGKEISAFIFLTNTLEFVFAASHLIELGWNYSIWRKKSSVLSHPFAIYINSFEANLNMLKRLINSN